MDAIGSLIRWISEQIDRFFDYLEYLFILVINKIIAAFAVAIDFSTAFLPDLTLPTFSQLSNDNQALTMINFFMPVDILIIVLLFWLSSDVIYIVVAPILRWFKLIAR